MENVFLGLNIIALNLLIFLIGAGGYDLYLCFRDKRTISQRIHAWFPKWLDMVVLCGILGLIWWLLGPNYFVTVLIGVILGHLFWQDR